MAERYTWWGHKLFFVIWNCLLKEYQCRLLWLPLRKGEKLVSKYGISSVSNTLFRSGLFVMRPCNSWGESLDLRLISPNSFPKFLILRCCQSSCELYAHIRLHVNLGRVLQTGTHQTCSVDFLRLQSDCSFLLGACLWRLQMTFKCCNNLVWHYDSLGNCMTRIYCITRPPMVFWPCKYGLSTLQCRWMLDCCQSLYTLHSSFM